jgi:hypothetical protein
MWRWVVTQPSDQPREIRCNEAKSRDTHSISEAFWHNKGSEKKEDLAK